MSLTIATRKFVVGQHIKYVALMKQQQQQTIIQQQNTTRSLATMHKAKGNWEQIVKSRPHDYDDDHKCFGPWNPKAVWFSAGLMLFLGIGSMQGAMVFQQYKQGFYKRSK